VVMVFTVTVLRVSAITTFLFCFSKQRNPKISNIYHNYSQTAKKINGCSRQKAY